MAGIYLWVTTSLIPQVISCVCQTFPGQRLRQSGCLQQWFCGEAVDKVWIITVCKINHHFTSEVAAVVLCAHELRQIGDEIYWRYKMLEILIRNYNTVTQIK
ncbi:phorbol-12-myristate-13-acetate-induced protein 1 isoform X1 [Odontesthes bonariensis]|uniref:phorbol-12-myristate-13-acetate-induced protein 1 isoform X1 n=1 Tax=Odontesthes bonariensis TaxID=219752 RepID=UPI003F58887D